MCPPTARRTRAEGPAGPRPLRRADEALLFREAYGAFARPPGGAEPDPFLKSLQILLRHEPDRLLRRERISQAKRRLADTADDIKEIAEQVGYSDRYFFSKDFKKHTGFTPSQFRVRETDRLRAE
ncbi:MAG: helix-turn-helix transcriptional regulator [Opitutia bacterium]